MSRESIQKEIADLETARVGANTTERATIDANLLDARARLAAIPITPPPPHGPTPHGQGQSSGDSGAGGRFRRDLEDFARREQSSSTGSMLYNPSVETLRGLECIILDVKVATPEQLDQISRLWQSAGAPAGAVGQIALDIAIQCVHNGSSRLTRLPGFCPNWPQMLRVGATSMIQRVCTLRQFCMFYAKVVWSYLIENDIPPSSWAQQGYRHSERFAAFDFFLGVLNGAAMQPLSMTRQPTDAEIQANKANGAVSIEDSVRATGIKASSDVRITGGNIGMLPMLIEAPDDD